MNIFATISLAFTLAIAFCWPLGLCIHQEDNKEVKKIEVRKWGITGHTPAFDMQILDFDSLGAPEFITTCRRGQAAEVVQIDYDPSHRPSRAANYHNGTRITYRYFENGNTLAKTARNADGQRIHTLISREVDGKPWKICLNGAGEVMYTHHQKKAPARLQPVIRLSDGTTLTGPVTRKAEWLPGDTPVAKVYSYIGDLHFETTEYRLFR